MIDMDITNDIIFQAKADAVPFNYRISYKVSLICLIIKKSCGKKGCSAIKLQMISAAIASSKLQRSLLNAINNEITNEYSTLIRFDPSINRAINIAITDKLIYRQGNGLFRLTDKGKTLIATIDKDNEMLLSEKKFLSKLSNKLTEEFIIHISKKMEANINDKNK